MTDPSTFRRWTTRGWGVRVERPEELFHLINSIAMLDSSRTYAWRGQRNADWKLASFLYRHLDERGIKVTEETLRAEEKRIIEEARRWGLGRDLGASATDLHLLATLQHHGVPTRLIDVTSNPMTALWFALEEPRATDQEPKRNRPGVLFAIDVTGSEWRESFSHGDPVLRELEEGIYEAPPPLSAGLEDSLRVSESSGEPFRIFPALPDERMKAQEGFFIGSSVPTEHSIPGVLGFNPAKVAPGKDKLQKLLAWERTQGRPQNLPFCAIIIPAALKRKIRDPLKRTYNRRRRVLFPDVDGFKDAFERMQLD
ncbi:FRG domain-containing protein [Brachybacterium squillarum]|uniref:FRG domain-containing protein n=1 Tax=Brachybacterium squillarum TaxID=661979 RepID=UPI0022225064|nr:FRG domain-containing protein [Brachybacterium squillarum]MCW1805267.1 FRG domain-containing protein [Brachybacterium squillarum]